MKNGVLKPEDYLEPACLLCGEPFGAEPKPRPIPQRRVLEKLDEYRDRRDYPAAERHLRYWLEEALLGRDKRGELVVRNELIGHYRKTGARDKALEQVDAALALLDALDFGETRSAGTTLVNAATACSAFGENERALALFERARAVYAALPKAEPALLGGLCNNMALACQALGRFDEAMALYEQAIAHMGAAENGEPEQAISYLNMADAVEAAEGAEAGESRIFALLDRAEALLRESKAPRDGYYAFVCEKCAPCFDHHGYFLTAQALREEAQAIYERA